MTPDLIFALAGIFVSLGLIAAVQIFFNIRGKR